MAHAELKQAQSRMLQQAKMASLGQTAAGVAHEINNPLAFVTNNITVLQREVAGLHDIILLYQQADATLAADQRELLGRIRDLAEEVDLPYMLGNLDGLLDRSRDGLRRIQKIVEDLRDFAHLDEADLKEADLNAGVVATVGMMRSLADERRVALETDLAPLPRLACYPAKINLVVQNLLSNAIDACRRGRPGRRPDPRPTARSRSRSPTPAAGSTRRSATRSSTPSSPPSRSARGPAWASRSATGSSRTTAARSTSTRPPAGARDSPSACRRPRRGNARWPAMATSCWGLTHSRPAPRRRSGEPASVPQAARMSLPPE